MSIILSQFIQIRPPKIRRKNKNGFTCKKNRQYNFTSFTMNLFNLLLLIIFGFAQINCLIKTWIQDPANSLTSSNGEQNQCVKSKAIYGKEIDGLLYMKDQQNINEIILPRDGAIIVLSNSKVELSNADKKCTDVDISDIKPFEYKSKRLWFSSKSWSTDGETENVAKSSVFKIPCECDTIVFPNQYAASVDLEYVDEIVADKILINDRTDDFNEFLETKIGQKMFLNSEAVRFVQGFCHPPNYCGCHNHKRFNEYTDLICDEESKYCEEPHCLQPIKPAGNCCPICGSILNFRIRDTCEFNITHMNEVGRKLNRFRNGKYVKKLNYYAGMVPGKHRDDNIVQLVIAEIDEYTGISVEFMNFLTKDDRFKGKIA